MLLNFGYRNCSDILPQALRPVSLITSQFMATYDNIKDQQFSQTSRKATHDPPGSFLFSNQTIQELKKNRLLVIGDTPRDVAILQSDNKMKAFARPKGIGKFT